MGCFTFGLEDKVNLERVVVRVDLVLARSVEVELGQLEGLAVTRQGGGIDVGAVGLVGYQMKGYVLLVGW